jgi:hypothetical protein
MLDVLAATASMLLVGERGLFHFPTAAEVRVQAIAKSDNELGWPFSVDAGSLTCVWSGGTRVVMFFAQTLGGPITEDVVDDDKATSEPRGVLLSINPLELTIGNMATNDLFVKAESIEERLRLVAPFVTVGQRLCDQPPGAQVRGGEL